MEALNSVAMENSSQLIQVNRSCSRGDNLSTLLLQEMYPEKCRSYVPFLYGKVIPMLAILVTIVNSTVISVFLKPKIRSNTSVILTLIALSEILGIVCPSITYVYFYTLGNYVYPVPFHLCRLTYYVADIFRDIFNFLSLWLTVLLAYVRTVCISSPFTAHDAHSKKDITTAMVIIIVMALVVHVPAMFIFNFEPLPVMSLTGNITYVTCRVTVTDILGICALRKTHLWMFVILHSFVPCVLLVFLDVTMLMSLRRADKNRKSLQNDKPFGKNFIDPKEKTKILNWNRSEPEQRQINCKSCSCEDINTRRKLTRTGTPLICDGFGYGQPELEDCRHAGDSDHDCKNLCCRKTLESKKNPKFCSEHLLTRFISKIHHNRRFGKMDSVKSSDSAFERLRKESRRTSWYIILVVAIVSSHEIPSAIIYCYTLMTHQGRLPKNLYGCRTMVMLIWQYITYSLIFLIYCCMCSAFRIELWKTITCRGRNRSRSNVKKRAFMSPCLIRKHLSPTRGEDSQEKMCISVDKDTSEHIPVILSGDKLDVNNIT